MKYAFAYDISFGYDIRLQRMDDGLRPYPPGSFILKLKFFSIRKKIAPPVFSGGVICFR